MKKKPSFSVVACLMGMSFLVLFSVSSYGQFDGKVASFIVADAENPNAAELELISRLEEMMFEVEVVGQNFVTDASVDGVDLVLISATVGSGTVAGNMPGLADLEIPVINWEPFLYDEQGFQADNGGEFNTREIDIIRDDHPLAAGLPEGLTTISHVEKAVSYGTPEGDAIIIAVNMENPEQVVLFGYDTGAAMAVGNAPARRVGTFLLNDVADDMTEDGWMLFDASVKWAMNHEDSASAVKQTASHAPSEFMLYNNFPNPFNPMTNISFSLPKEAEIRLSVWNSLGEKRMTLVEGTRSAGIHTVPFDASS
ncbi:MAG TPA: hypothetical protein ENN17_12755, partial [bacterium]|nr:hypothetical protein [bacterium]